MVLLACQALKTKIREIGVLQSLKCSEVDSYTCFGSVPNRINEVQGPFQMKSVTIQHRIQILESEFSSHLYESSQHVWRRLWNVTVP